MKIKFDLQLNVWLDSIEIEGESEEDCLDNLRKMSAEEILKIANVKESDLIDVDGEIVEQDYKVRVTNIVYNINTEDVLDELENEGIDNPSPEEIEKKLDELEHSAPEVVTLNFTCSPDDLEDVITDELSDSLGMMIETFSYKIINIK